jgi:hypothetical protein
MSSAFGESDYFDLYWSVKPGNELRKLFSNTVYYLV